MFKLKFSTGGLWFGLSEVHFCKSVATDKGENTHSLRFRQAILFCLENSTRQTGGKSITQHISAVILFSLFHSVYYNQLSSFISMFVAFINDLSPLRSGTWSLDAHSDGRKRLQQVWKVATHSNMQHICCDSSNSFASP